MNLQTKIFYKVDGFLYRNLKFKEEDLITIHSEFREDCNRKSREKAFAYYNSLLEVLLESIGLKYQNKEQVERDLKCFYNSNKKEQHPKLPNVVFDNDIDKLVTISFCSTNVKPYITKTGLKIYEGEKIIDAFGYQSESLEKKINRNLLLEEMIDV